MKKIGLIIAVVCVLAGFTGASASALTAGQAYVDAEQYALHHFSGGPELYACNLSGKNKAGEAQYYCWGYFTKKSGEWKVNVGPYGEITYARE